MHLPIIDHLFRLKLKFHFVWSEKGTCFWTASYKWGNWVLQEACIHYLGNELHNIKWCDSRGKWSLYLRICISVGDKAGFNDLGYSIATGVLYVQIGFEMIWTLRQKDMICGFRTPRSIEPCCSVQCKFLGLFVLESYQIPLTVVSLLFSQPILQSNKSLSRLFPSFVFQTTSGRSRKYSGFH